MDEPVLSPEYEWMKRGVPVWYSPRSAPHLRFAGVVASAPRRFRGAWVVALTDVESTYARWRGKAPWLTTALAAPVETVRRRE